MENKIRCFDDLYYNELLSVLTKYEKFRQALFNKTIIIELATALCFVGFYFINDFFVKKNDFYAAFEPAVFVAVVIIALTIIIWTPIDNFKKFKTGLKNRAQNTLKKTFGDLKWGQSSVNDNLIRGSQIFGDYNRISYDDKFVGNYKETSFSVAETSMLYIVEGKHKMVFPVFKGVIISFKSNKKIMAHTIVTTKGDASVRNYNPAIWYIILMMLPGIWVGLQDSSVIWVAVVCLVGLVYAIIDTIIKYRKFKGVKLEDLKFDKRFNVFSKDQIEARYLLTPSFMDRLNNLRTSFGTKKIKCAFFDDKIVFAISTPKDLFELGDFHRSLINKRKVKEFYDEITAIYNMIDYFKLSEKTGL